MPMVALLSDAAFDSETTQLLGAAFDAAWEDVKTSGTALAEGAEAALTRELLAKRIIELAKRGERNPDLGRKRFGSSGEIASGPGQRAHDDIRCAQRGDAPPLTKAGRAALRAAFA